jgi:hypothetical protein
MLMSVTTMMWLLTTFSTALRQSNNALKILLYLSVALPLSLKAYNFASTQTREIHKRGRERIDPNDVCTCWLQLCSCLRRLGVLFIAPNGLGAVGASFGSSQPSLVAGAQDCPVAHRTMNSNGSDWQFPSLEQLAVGAPDRLLFTVLCTGQVTIHCPVHRTGHYSLSYAPDTATIHCPVHRTQLLFTVLCIGHSYYSMSCAPDTTTIHCPVHRTTTIHYPVHQPTTH